MLFFNRHKRLQFPYERDIHAHLLPALDDGVQTMDEALCVVCRLVRVGLKRLTCTPHVMFPAVMNNRVTINSALLTFKARVREEGIDMEIDAGAEYRLGEFMLGLLEQGDIMASTRGEVLIEHGFMAPSVYADDIIFGLLGQGYQPVMAHPERYPFYGRDVVRHCERLKEKGCKIQVNILSFSGYYGNEVRKSARKLYDTGWVDYYAGDLHNLRQEMILEKIIGGAIF